MKKDKETLYDFAGLKQARESLRESEELYRRLFEVESDAIILLDCETSRILDVNEAVSQLYGYSREEALLLKVSDISAEPANTMRAICEGKTHVPIRWHRRKNGTLFPVEISGSYFEYKGRKTHVAAVRDITERLKLEAQLRQAQKMEAIGQIAGGIAHDFNNILSAMMGFITIMQMKTKDGDPQRDYLEQLYALTERAESLVKNLLTFGRKQVLDVRPISLNDAIRTVGKLLSRVISEDIRLDLKLSQRDIVIKADMAQMEQALMNLATNARDAMPEGGALTISTEPFEMHDFFIRMHGYGKEGNYALMTVEDTGMGMDDLTREKIFDPFFTTKDVGKGTGLGLAMVYGIVKQHDGYIEVYSEMGVGTVFSIYLPALDMEAGETKTKVHVPVSGGTETILLAEDEESLRRVTRKMLEEFGYSVIEAQDGADAVAKFIERRNEIELVIMDVIMPRKSGKEAYQEMSKIQPDVKVLFTSGHTGDILTSKKISEEGLHFIAKPFQPKDLFEKIRETLKV